MAHPLYHHATRLVGQPVYVHHVNGTVYHGTLITTAMSGIYVVQHPPGTRLAAAAARDPGAAHALGSTPDVAAKLVYGPAAYFGFGALTGLTAAALFSPWVW